MRYRLRNCCLQGLKIRSMETKRFRLRLLISRAGLGEKPLEIQRAELEPGSTADVLGSASPSWWPLLTAPTRGHEGDGTGVPVAGVKAPSWSCTQLPSSLGRERERACLCAGRSKPRGELLPLHCKFFEGELIHFVGSGISCSLNTFLFPMLPVQQAHRHKGDECGTGLHFMELKWKNETMAACPLCFAPSLPNDVQGMVRCERWPCLDVVWVAFGLAAAAGGAACGSRSGFASQPTEEPGQLVPPWGCLSVRLLQQEALMWLPHPTTAGTLIFLSQILRRIQTQQTRSAAVAPHPVTHGQPGAERRAHYSHGSGSATDTFQPCDRALLAA